MDQPPVVRAGGTRVQVFKSGLEVWLYDAAHLEAIRGAATSQDSGADGMPGGFEAFGGTAAAEAPTDLLTTAKGFARFFEQAARG